MAVIWKIALFGSEVFYEPDGNSEVLLSAMSVTDPMMDTNWKKYDVLGAPADYKAIEEFTEVSGGIVIHNKAQKKIIDIEFVDFKFPDDRHKVDELSALLRKQWVYFYKGEFTFDNWKPHSDDACVLVAATKSIEDVYENGVTRIKMSLRGLKPKID